MTALLALVGLAVASAVLAAASGRIPSPAASRHVSSPQGTPRRVPSPAPARRHAVPHAVTVNTFSVWLDEAQVAATGAAQWATIARHDAVVVLNSWDYRLIPVLRRASPRIQVWVYKDLSGVRSDDCTTADGDCGGCAAGVADGRYLSSGLGYCWVRRYHPDWLLGGAGTGEPIQFAGYPRTWETDYGNAGYLRRWISNVLTDVRSHGWDGVAVDNALTTADAYGVAAKYPTDPAVQAATFAALRQVGPALHDAGVQAVFNVGYTTAFPGLWQRWLSQVDGLEQEFYLSYSTRPNAVGAAWGVYQDEVAACAAAHKRCWFHAGDYSAKVTTQTREYALASYLLATDGQQFLAVGDMAPGPMPGWPLGPPVRAMTRAGSSWRRYFAGGVAVVNPSGFRSTVFLGGTYLDDNGNPVAAVTLGPASGAVLRVAGGR
jgi:Hypothetical glycosyl hydrolase family 15